MNSISRGIRNAFRSVIRTASIVLILGLSVGLSLAMLVARQAVEDKITSVKTTYGNTISISPAGVRGFEGGGEALADGDLAKIADLPHVVTVSKTLQDRLTTETSNLQSAIDAGSLGNRRANDSGVGFQAAPAPIIIENSAPEQTNSSQPVVRTFTPPVSITGITDATNPEVYGGSSVTYSSGQAVDPSKNEDTAVIGKSLAEKNNLSVGSTFTAYGKPITVVGIFDAGNDFANNGVVMSLASLQRLSNQAGAITNAVVTTSSIDTVDAVVTAIQGTLGDKADVISNAENAKESIKPLENVKTIALFSLIGAVVAGAVIILLTMVMIVRERRREIGVMKAIGASNRSVMMQFICEALTLTTIALIAGFGIGVVAAGPITNTLVTNSANSTASTQIPNGPTTVLRGPAGGSMQMSGGPRMFRSFGANSTVNIRNIKASAGLDTLVYGVLFALIIAAVGSALPALLISKIRPAEIMRAD